MSKRLGSCFFAAFFLGADFFFAPLLFVKALFDFFLVTLVVQLEQPLEDFTAGGFADSVAEALFSFVEAMVEVEAKGKSGSNRLESSSTGTS